MGRDLLGAVKATGPTEDASQGVGRYGGATEATTFGTAAPDDVAPVASASHVVSDEMTQFYELTEIVKKDLAEIQQLYNKLSRGHEEYKVASRTEDMKGIRGDMEEVSRQVKVCAQKLNARFKEIDAQNKKSEEAPGCGPGSVSERMRTHITVGLKRKMKEAMDDFDSLRSKIADEYKEMVERRMYTMQGVKPSPEDVEKVVESGEAEGLYQQAILNGGRERVKDTLAEIRERHDAVKGLEESLLELHQMFLDMAVLVEQQGVMLDNIHTQVKRSVDAVVKGTRKIQQAKEYQKSTRKWMMCGCFTVLIIIAIIILAVKVL